MTGQREAVAKAAADLIPGDRIASGWLPEGDAADVLLAIPYSAHRSDWMFVAYRHFGDGYPAADSFLADAVVPLEVMADASGLGYSREADDPTPVSPARVPMHTGSVVDGGELVTDEPITVHFSFGHGQRDPDTNEHLLDKYVTIVGPSYEACRAAMFASRFGNRWSFDYVAGTPTADKWIPQWTEHERIDVVDETPGGCE